MNYPKDDELEGRAAVAEWVEASARFRAAESALVAAGDGNFDTDQCAAELVEEYEEAQDEMAKAEKAMLAGKPAKKSRARAGEEAEAEEDDPVERQRAHFERIQRNRVDQQMTEADARNRQQDFERQRIELESAMAARELDKAGAPGLPAQPGEATQRASSAMVRKVSSEKEKEKPTPDAVQRLKPGKTPRPGASAGGEVTADHGVARAPAGEPAGGVQSAADEKAETKRELLSGQQGPGRPANETVASVGPGPGQPPQDIPTPKKTTELPGTE